MVAPGLGCTLRLRLWLTVMCQQDGQPAAATCTVTVCRQTEYSKGSSR